MKAPIEGLKGASVRHRLRFVDMEGTKPRFTKPYFVETRLVYDITHVPARSTWLVFDTIVELHFYDTARRTDNNAHHLRGEWGPYNEEWYRIVRTEEDALGPRYTHRKITTNPALAFTWILGTKHQALRQNRDMRMRKSFE